LFVRALRRLLHPRQAGAFHGRRPARARQVRPSGWRPPPRRPRSRGDFTLPAPPRVFALAFSPDGKRLVSSGEDGSLHLWDALTGKQIRSFVGHKGRVNLVAFSPDGRTLASGGDRRGAVRAGDGSWEDPDEFRIRLWDVGTGQERRCLVGPGILRLRLAF